MSLFEEISALLIKLKGTPYFEVIEGTFFVNEDDQELNWNSDGNLEELYEGNGATYSAELNGGCWEQDGCSFFNVNNGCGETITYVFHSKCEVYYDDLEEMFNGEDDE